jgi:hypothetical protein
MMKELSAWSFGRERMEEIMTKIYPTLAMVGAFHRTMGTEGSLKAYVMFLTTIFVKETLSPDSHVKQTRRMRRVGSSLFDCCQGVLRIRYHLPQVVAPTGDPPSALQTDYWLVGSLELPFLQNFFDWEVLRPLTGALASPDSHANAGWEVQMAAFDRSYGQALGNEHDTVAALWVSPIRYFFMSDEWTEGDWRDRFVTRESVSESFWANRKYVCEDPKNPDDLLNDPHLNEVESAAAYFEQMSAAVSNVPPTKTASGVAKLRFFDAIFAQGEWLQTSSYHLVLDDKELLDVLAHCVLNVGVGLFRQLLDRATRIRLLDLNTTTGTLFDVDGFGGGEGSTEGTILMLAAAAGRLDLCKVLVDEHNVKDESSTDGRFARCFAIENKHRQVNSYLESKDFAVSATSFEGLAAKLLKAFFLFEHEKVECLLHEASAAVLFFTNRPQTVNLARKLLVFVIGGNEYELDIDYRATPREVKRKLAEQTGIPVWQMQLWDQNTGELEDNTTLAVEIQTGMLKPHNESEAAPIPYVCPHLALRVGCCVFCIRLHTADLLVDTTKKEPTKPDIDALDGGDDPRQLLHFAVLMDDLHLMRILLEAGADIDYQTKLETLRVGAESVYIRYEGLFVDVHHQSPKERKAARARGGGKLKPSPFAEYKLDKSKRALSMEVYCGNCRCLLFHDCSPSCCD